MNNILVHLHREISFYNKSFIVCYLY